MTRKLSMFLIVAAVAYGCGSPGEGPKTQEEPAAAEQPSAGSTEEILSGDFESGTTEEWAVVTDDQPEADSEPDSEGPGDSN